MNPQGQEDQKRGIREFVVGTGGTRKDTLATGIWPAELAAAQDTTFGVLRITLARRELHVGVGVGGGQPAFSDAVETPVDCA